MAPLQPKRLKWQDYIVANEAILAGKPVIKGTRLAVDFILELLANGWTEKDLFDSYPQLTKEHLAAVFAFAADNVKEAMLYKVDSAGGK